ncbi:MAG: GGDEF domain-containing protein [Alphaproteobacteria bacterium]|nr:GGDEF domain-containing protein [Alphaproteobacteria bacterium]
MAAHSFSTAEKIKKISVKALSRIKTSGLSAIPEIYEVWYVYYAKSNGDVTKSIDILESKGIEITDEQCLEIHRLFLSEHKETDQVRAAGERIQETIKDVTGAVADIQQATSRFGSSLAGVTGHLSADMSREEIEAALKNIVSETGEMLAVNQALAEQLNKSTQAMAVLQQDMEVVRKEAFTDGLTGLLNRKAFDAELDRIAMQSGEEGQTFSLIMMDIDYFKGFNDNFGHQVGDQVLRLVARALVDGVKGRDVAARYGGEEFAVILPETPLEGGMKVANYLRKAVEGKDIINRTSGERLGKITLSGGVAQYVPGEDLAELVERADSALYTAKHNGRNQIAAAPTPGQKKAMA